MSSKNCTPLSSEDEEYLKQVYEVMQKWIEEKRELEKNIKSLETKLEEKYPDVAKSCRSIFELEQQEAKASQAVEDARIEIGLLEENIDILESSKNARGKRKT